MASVGSLSNTELKLVPLSVLIHSPPEAVPTTITLWASAATAVMRPVIGTAGATGEPVKLASSDIGIGPSGLHWRAAAGRANAAAPAPSLFAISARRCALA